jgi:hypothetical protein
MASCLIKYKDNFTFFLSFYARIFPSGPDHKHSSIFCVIAPCSLLKVNRRFGGVCRLHLKDRIIIQKRKQRENGWQAFTLVYCLAYYSTLKMEATYFSESLCWPSTDYTALYPRDRTLHNRRFEKLNTYDHSTYFPYHEKPSFTPTHTFPEEANYSELSNNGHYYHGLGKTFGQPSRRYTVCSCSFISIRSKVKRLCNRPWWPIGSWNIEAPTFSPDNRLTDGGKVVSLTLSPPFTPREIPGTHFC